MSPVTLERGVALDLTCFLWGVQGEGTEKEAQEVAPMLDALQAQLPWKEVEEHFYPDFPIEALR